MDRRGVMDFPLEFLPNIFFTVIAFGVLIGIMLWFSNVQVDAQELKANVVAGRILHSDAILYQDVTNRTYSGTVDLAKLNSSNLERAINYSSEREAAAMVRVMDNSGNTVKTAYLHERWFRVWNPLAKLEGQGSAIVVEIYTPINYVDADETLPGRLNITVVVPR